MLSTGLKARSLFSSQKLSSTFNKPAVPLRSATIRMASGKLDKSTSETDWKKILNPEEVQTHHLANR